MADGVIQYTLGNIDQKNKIFASMLGDPMLCGKMFEVAAEVLRDKVELIVYLAKINVRVDTGSLRDSIRSQRLGIGRKIVTVRAGGYVRNPKTGRMVDYAGVIEARFPYLRPAVDAVKAEIKNSIVERVIMEVSD